VKRITGLLVAQAVVMRPETKDWKWSMKIIDDPKTVNAWCMAGGKMALYTGLVEKIEPTDDELAQVIGHEIEDPHAAVVTRQDEGPRRCEGIEGIDDDVVYCNRAVLSRRDRHSTILRIGSQWLELDECVESVHHPT